MEEQKTSKRVRINLDQTAKGLVQIDITSEGETAAEREAELNEAFAVARRVIAKNGLKEVGNE
jgi:DNA-binding transcriptional regulator LsrR (DeoR family)